MIVFRLRFILLLSTLLLFSSHVSGQSRKARKYFRDAQELVRQGNYPEVKRNLRKAIKESPEYVEAYVFLGDLYLLEEDFENSGAQYKEALNQGGADFIYYKLGISEFNLGEYEKARLSFEKYKNYPRATPSLVVEVNRYLTNCDFASKAIRNPVPFDPVALPVNTDAMEYFPSISGDGKTLVYTSRDPEGRKRDEDFYVSFKTDSGWTTGSRLEGRLNSNLNEGAQSLSADGNFLFFAGCERFDGYGSCDIYFSYKQGNGQWSEPRNLGDSINSRAWESQPSISADGQTLYFTRGKSGRSKNTNIMVSTFSPKGYWTKAQALSDRINNQYIQESPFIHFDNHSLYFVSNGHPGMGGKDIYVSRKKTDGSWTTPKNLGYPINTYRDEFSLIIGPDGKTGFYASDISPDKGKVKYYDLYTFTLEGDNRATPIAWIEGMVKDKDDEKSISTEIEIFNLTNNNLQTTIRSAKNGYFSVALPANSDYSLDVNHKGYLIYSKNFSLSTTTEIDPQKLDVLLEKIKVDEQFVLSNILFETNKYNLLEPSKNELNTLVRFLKENPTIKIEIQGHTDNIGTPISNLELSKSRAKSVLTYLVKNGISKDRLTSIGFGEKLPMASNDTEEGRRQNRRTEIKILAM